VPLNIICFSTNYVLPSMGESDLAAVNVYVMHHKIIDDSLGIGMTSISVDGTKKGGRKIRSK